jgi:hypothetical protein
MNDVWSYSVGLNQWLWLSGSKVAPNITTYGVTGVSDPANTITGRAYHEMVYYALTNSLFMFGGIDNTGD